MINYYQKDRLFKFIFGREEHKKYTLSLYNALNDSHYEDPNDLILNTLDDFLYIGMKNDVSFLLGETLSLYEHQSTFNPNMPMRMFLYLAKIYEKYIEEKDLYLFSSKQIFFPAPSLVVFYNGDRKTEDVEHYHLSSSFKGPSSLEVDVRMINIRSPGNRELRERCEALDAYNWFNETVRILSSSLDKEEAVDRAILQMPEHYEVKKLLNSHKAEVKGMVFTEFDEKKFIEQTRRFYEKEGREMGLIEGREEGREEGRKLGLEEGKTEGHTESRTAIVRRMSEKGLDPSMIADLTGIPLEEVENYLK